jgi:toxin ParE1/3/4
MLVRESARVSKTREKAGPARQRSSLKNSKLPKAYLIEITPRAERDLAALYLQIHAVDSEHARQWYLGFTAAIPSLGEMPNRNPATPENKRLKQLLYGNKPHVYRAIFRVRNRERRVEILHIRHGARQIQGI